MFEKEFEFVVDADLYTCVLQLDATKRLEIWRYGIAKQAKYKLLLKSIDGFDKYSLKIVNPYFPSYYTIIDAELIAEGNKTYFIGKTYSNAKWLYVLFGVLLVLTVLSFAYKLYILALILFTIWYSGWANLIYERNKLISTLKQATSTG